MKQGSFEDLNQLGKAKTPFVFFLSYDKQQLYVCSKDNWENHPNLHFNFLGYSNNLTKGQKVKAAGKMNFQAPKKQVYKDAFAKVRAALKAGDTYLLNLTYQSHISFDEEPIDIYHRAKSKFKAFFLDKYLFFSPEKFIEIVNNTIRAYPMKGTIEANVPNAKEKLIKDLKETAEHNTIVDLLRNDISQVATETVVEKYRYIDKIKTHKGDILQASSQIAAKVNSNWKSQIGSILDQLTPAGSISGAPKQRTLEIIEEIEDYNRGFYTGICGVFTGESLHTGVMIRFMEKTAEGWVFKSGGGIHHLSDCDEEYAELKQKIYLPN